MYHPAGLFSGGVILTPAAAAPRGNRSGRPRPGPGSGPGQKKPLGATGTSPVAGQNRGDAFPSDRAFLGGPGWRGGPFRRGGAFRHPTDACLARFLCPECSPYHNLVSSGVHTSQRELSLPAYNSLVALLTTTPTRLRLSPCRPPSHPPPPPVWPSLLPVGRAWSRRRRPSVRPSVRPSAVWAGTSIEYSPVLAAPVTVPALFATVRARPGPFRPVNTASSCAWMRF